MDSSQALDRGGYSKANLKRASQLGVKRVGIAPTGKARWNVSDNMAENIRCERAQMETCGHRAFLGFNLCKIVREVNLLQVQST